MRDPLEAFLRLQAERGCTPATLAKVRSQLERFLAWCGVELAELQESHLAGYLAHLRARPELHERTALRLVGGLRPFLTWATGRGLVWANPAQDLQLPAPGRALIRVLTVDQVVALLEAPSSSTRLGVLDRAVLETLYGTGVRHQELVQLDLADWDPAGETLRVRRGKGGPPRLAPLGPQLGQVLADYRERVRAAWAWPAETALFVTAAGGRLGYEGVARLVSRAARQAGLGRVTPHMLRHAFASHLLARGADLRHVQALLGHQTVQATEFYTHVLPLELMAEYRRTHPRARRRRPR